MNRLLVVFLTIVLTSSFTLASAGELMTPDAMSRMGLAQAWARPVHVPSGAQSIRDQQLYVHEKAPHEYITIVAPKPALPADAADQASAKKADTTEPETVTPGSNSYGPHRHQRCSDWTKRSRAFGEQRNTAS